ncbi:unnamed protein product, partial [Owenia fusiformis]
RLKMGHKDKKKSHHRSRSRSRDRDRRKKSKKKKRHYSDSESSSSRSNSSSPERPKKSKRDRSPPRKSSSAMTLEELEQKKQETRREKELMKSLETPEEKRARRLAKKEMKEKRRKHDSGWDDETLGYSNVDNPFGDERLHQTFVWGKKMEKEGKKHLDSKDIHRIQKQKMEETKRELEKVKQRRLEREREREERQNEQELMQREKEVEYYHKWESQEDTFHLQQAMLRSKIRIQDGRAKPIDLLAKYISAEDDEMELEMHEPYSYLNGLSIEDLEDLLEDIKVYGELEQGKNADYWRDITIITDDELVKLRKIDPSSRDYIGDRRQGVNKSVLGEVAGVFKGKTYKQLTMLEGQIKNKLKGGEGVDVGYWETLLGQLKAHMARTRLRERHQTILKRKLQKLKQEQGIENVASDSNIDAIPSTSRETTQPSRQESSPPTNSQPQPGGSKEQQEEEGQMKEEQDDDSEPDEAILTVEDLMEQSMDEYTLAGYSPKLVRQADLDPDVIIYDPEDDMKRLEFARRQFLSTGSAKLDADAELVKRAREGMNDEEAQFSVEVPLEHQAILWSDRYRPRKPRFFNRVHTGFEWNKYNQTHYDIDNPPPKIVQGYKFNIFYPDLIDKTKTPEYTLTPDPANKDFGVLRFRAGPPYEDIGFKVVNREWEYSYKRGFRCQFQNNIFQLWYHFKRYRYRR